MARSLTGLDSAFLAVETDAAHMHLTAVVTLDPVGDRPASFDDIRAHLAPRLRGLPVFRRHLREVPLGLDHPVWVEQDFDLDLHLHRVAVPAPGTAVELSELVSHLAGISLDRDRPLWDLWVVEGLDHDRTALVMRIHHALIDGVAGAEIFGRLFDVAPDAPAASETQRPLRQERAPSRGRLLLGAARSLAGKPLRIARQTLDSAAAALRSIRSAAAAEAGPTAGLPGSRSGASREDATEEPFSEMSGQALRREDATEEPPIQIWAPAPSSPLNGAITSRREVALGGESLDALLALKRVFGVKLNDVVLAVCAGALRRYLCGRGETPEVPLVAAIPVSVAPDGSSRTTGNHVSAMTVELPVHLGDPVSRLSSVRRATRRAKRAHRAIGGELVSGWAEIAPPVLLSGATNLYSRLDLADHHRPVVNLIVSNVRGPRIGLYCAGHRVMACHPLGPIYEGCALNLTVFSHDGRVDFGLTACPEVVPDVARIAQAMSEATSELRAAVECGRRRSARRVTAARPRDASAPRMGASSLATGL